jgi:hypothetical protein
VDVTSTMNLELLSPENHRSLRLRRTGNAAPHFVQIVAREFAVAAASFPIVFSKDAATGNFYAGAMLGFEPGESFLADRRSRGGFEPLSLQRDGFFTSGEQIAIDRDNPRFSDTDGEPLFDEAQQPSGGLRHIQWVLGQLQAGIEVTNVFIRALLELRLIEPIDVSLHFDNGEHLQLKGLYTVSLDSIRELDDAAAMRLFRAGHLQLAYIMSATLNQISSLASLRNRRLAGDFLLKRPGRLE